MTRVASKLRNVEIFNATKGLGKLSDAEYKKLEKKLQEIKDFSRPVPFDEKTDIILGQIPDSQGPAKVDNIERKDGRPTYKVSIILPDASWASFLTADEEEVKVFEAHLGCPVAVVGKITTKELPPAEGRETAARFQNIKPYRGSLIIPDPDFGKKAAAAGGEGSDEFE